MHIIITDAWMAKRQALHLSGWKLLGAGVMASVLLMLGSITIYHWVFLEGVRQGWPGFASVARLIHQNTAGERDAYLRANLDAMARKLGELQARMVQLDALGQRVAGLAGLNPAEVKAPPGAGGTLIAPRNIGLEELSGALDRFDHTAGSQVDWLMAAESRLFDLRIQQSMVPTANPVPSVDKGSPFGWRIDPITGQSAMHTGLDFPGEVGTPIYAAAGGVVIAQEYHAAYGNLIDIDHGNQLVTRYAHASKVHVKAGDLVKRGQLIAEIGSTGRSTGPHLHFEVLVAGIPQDPQKFLAAGDTVRQAQAQAPPKRP